MIPVRIKTPRGYWRDVPAWERRDVTVCIAAVCEENTDDPKLIACADSKISTALGSSNTALKIRAMIGNGGVQWRCLTSGGDEDILAVLRLLKIGFRAAPVDETNIVHVTRTALHTRKLDKANELVQGKFAIPYAEFLATGKIRLPDDIFRAATTEVELINVNVDLIIVGYDSVGYPLMVKANGNKAAIKEDFVVAGEGGYLAQAALLSRQYHNLTSFDEALYAVYEAKKSRTGRAERRDGDPSYSHA